MQTSIVRARNLPSHNLYGDHGPRCPKCSGLGRYIGLVPGQLVQWTTICMCKGTGVDPTFTEEQRWASVIERLDNYELRLAQEIQKRQRLEATVAKLEAKSPKLSKQTWMEMIAWSTADGSSVSTAAVETILMPNITIPAGYMNDSRALRIRVFGKWTTTGSTPTQVFAMRWGGVAGTLLCKTAAITTVASTTAAGWDLDVIVQSRLNGSSGKLIANGTCRMFAGVATTIASATGNAAVTPMMNGGTLTPAEVTCDLTADTAFSVTGNGSTTALTIVGMQYQIESEN